LNVTSVLEQKKYYQMKSTLQTGIIAVTLLVLAQAGFAQAPDLGTVSDFVLFTGTGAFDNVGEATYVTGDVGKNTATLSAFPPGTLVGVKHVVDATSAQAASDLDDAYAELSTMGGSFLDATIVDKTLTPGVYFAGAASTLNGTLTLDGQGDPNALFIIRIGGAFETGISSNVILVNSASLSNVYWQIMGEFILGASSVFRGTIVAVGAISLMEGSTLYGRGLSTAGAIHLHSNVVTITAIPDLYNVTGGGGFCEGGAGLPVGLSGSQTGVNYQLKIDGVNTGSAVAGTNAAISFGNQTTAGTYTVLATRVITEEERIMSGNATVTHWPLPLTSAIYHQ
jgi:hypothetical protein